jgi:hypothetical protein
MNSPDYNYPPPPLFTPEQSAAIGEAFDRTFPQPGDKWTDTEGDTWIVDPNGELRLQDGPKGAPGVPFHLIERDVGPLTLTHRDPTPTPAMDDLRHALNLAQKALDRLEKETP